MERATWHLDCFVRPRDPVFAEILQGIVQLLGDGAAELFAVDQFGQSVVVAAAVAGSTRSVERRYTIPVTDAVVELRIRSGAEIEPALSSTLHVIIAMMARVLEDRRANPKARLEPQGLVVVRATGELRVVSPLVAVATGYEPSDAIGRNVFDHIHADDHDLAIDSLARTATFEGEKFPYDLRFLCKDGSSCLLEVKAEERADPTLDDIVFAVRRVDLRSGADAVIGDQWRLLDMIGRGERLENTLAEVARLASRRMRAACGVLLADSPLAVLRLIAAEGFSNELQIAIDGSPIGADANTCGLSAFRGQAVRSRDMLSDREWAPSWPVLLADGVETCWVDPILSDRSSHALGVLVFMADRDWIPSVDEVRVADLFASLASVAIQRTQAEAVLHHQAMHDQLTGLPNRALFLDRLEQALAHRRDRPTSVAVLFIDLDRFKIVNDALGHEAGDDLLIAVAARISGALRTGNSVARFGGDEFTVLADDVTSAADALSIGERIADAFRRPLDLAVGDLVMTVSIGVAISVDEPTTASSMLRDADSAMYRAKRRGRNRVELFDATMRGAAMARLDLVHALQEAVQSGDFLLHYQPEVDLRTLEVVGVEALLRWPHASKGLIEPAHFIPIAEETGAIVGLGEWVLDRACAQLVAWEKTNDLPPAKLWVNISAIQLLERGFPLRVRRVLEKWKVDPARLGLEITESAVMSDIEAAIGSLIQLRSLGLSTAIDDFGSGYASLNYLRRLPVDLVKIDHSFIDSIGAEERGLEIVAAIVDLVHATGARVLAEGVESKQQFLALQQVGCDEAQGYWISPPAAATSVPPSWQLPTS